LALVGRRLRRELEPRGARLSDRLRGLHDAPAAALELIHRELRLEGRGLQQPHRDGFRGERRHQAGEIASVRGARRAAEARRDGQGLHDGATGWGFCTPEAMGPTQAYRNPIDRKSTRLYSSHRTISYAVFCLKKKKKKKNNKNTPNI